MKTLLVLAEHPGLAEALRTSLEPEQYRIVARSGLGEAEPLLVHGLADACIADLELTGVEAIWVLEKLRRKAPHMPVILYAGAPHPDWEEEAYLRGAAHVLSKPVRGRMLSALLDRLWAAPTPLRKPPPAAPATTAEPVRLAQREATPETARTLAVLRDLSGILTYSLNAEAMLKQFLLLLRDILGVNRAAIFLRQPGTSFGNSPDTTAGTGLRAACSIGLSQNLLQHFELSFQAGIGAHLLRSGRILRRSSADVTHDVEAEKEFEVLGVQVAVPVLDREAVLGVAVFDGRITGEALLNSELELVFRLLEQLGLAIKNIWLHDQLAGNHQMMADILRELSSACVVVSRDLAILHANKTARRYFGHAERRGGELEFSDLPPALGVKIHQVLQTGSAITGFRYEPEESPGTVYLVNVVPFQRPAAGLPASALLMAEDLTQSEQLQRLKIEAENLRLVKTMADRLTHEVGNAMVRPSTYQQLLGDKLGKKGVDQEFLKVMERDWAEDNRRIDRRVRQMRYINVGISPSPESFPVGAVLEEAYQEARKYQPGKAAQFKIDAPAQPLLVKGNRSALKHALMEVMLNALQANPAEPRIGVRLKVDSASNGVPRLQVEIQDNGPGFSAEAAGKACEPFFTERNVGAGLGLTVSQMIIEAHRGKLEIISPKTGESGVVRIALPSEPSLKE